VKKHFLTAGLLLSAATLWAACGEEENRDACANIVCGNGFHCHDGVCMPDHEMQPDAGTEGDAGTEPDAGMEEPDAGMEEPDAGMEEPDAGTEPTTSMMIDDILATADGTGLSLPLNGGLVTFIKPQVGDATDDPAGFFLQRGTSGPAIFVAVDPASLTPAPAIGDEVDMTVTAVETVRGLKRVSAITDYDRVTTGENDVSLLSQNLSGNANWVATLDDYAAELVSIEGTLTSGFTGAGPEHQSAFISTAGYPMGNSNLKIRLPITLVQSFVDVVAGCEISLSRGIVWRNGNQGQPSAYDASDVTVTTCPAPKVVGATATSVTEVVVTFDRTISAAPPSAFSIDNNLAVISAAINGKSVTLTTGPQLAGTQYTITVGAGVTDTYGTDVDTSANSASFGAYSAVCVSPSVVISQFFGAGGASGAPFTNDFVELHNRGNSTVNLTGWTVQYGSATGTSFSGKINLSGAIPPGGFYLVQGAGGTNGMALPTADATNTNVNFAQTNGKVALVNSTTTLSGGCPTSGFVDFVPFGSTNCNGVSHAPAPSATTGIIRINNGCQDNNDNASVFSTSDASNPLNPRNSSSAAAVCGCI